MLGPSRTVLTIVLVVVTVNAVNFVDGLDGLAAGIVAIAAAAFFVYSYLLTVDGGPRPGDHSGRGDRGPGRACAWASCRTTSARRASSWATPARCCIGLLLASSTITLTGTVDAQRGRRRPRARPAAARCCRWRCWSCRSSTCCSPSSAAPRRPVAVRAGQAAPAPPAARDRPLPRARGAGDVPVVRVDRLRRDGRRASCSSTLTLLVSRRGRRAGRVLVTMNIPRLRRAEGTLHRPATGRRRRDRTSRGRRPGRCSAPRSWSPLGVAGALHGARCGRRGTPTGSGRVLALGGVLVVGLPAAGTAARWSGAQGRPALGRR